MKTKEARTILNENFGGDDDPSYVTFSKGQFTVREGFFYTHGRTANDLAKAVLEVLPNATIVDKGKIWRAFRGGANCKAQSHWFVKLTI